MSELYQCLVCGEFKRSDNLRRHYLSNILWSEDETPSSEKLELFMKETLLKGKRTSSDRAKIEHTKYFIQNGIQSVPPTSKHQTKSSKTTSINKFFAPNKKESTNIPSTTKSSSLTEQNIECSSVTDSSMTVEPSYDDVDALMSFDITEGKQTTVDDSTNPGNQTDNDEIISQNTAENENESQIYVKRDKLIPSSSLVKDQILISEIAASVCTEISKEFQGEPFLDELSNKIAEKIYNRIQNEEKDVDTTEDFWIKGEESYICKCCAQFSDHPDVPYNLKTHNKKLFGFININQKSKNLKYSLKAHESNDLHKYCQLRFINMKADQESKEIENEKAGKLVIRDGLFCFKKLSKFN